ncbi:GbpC/Spa domain-containing protein [Streptococcus sp. DD13]|uniref:GbpC/Spa domain-containing protein n=1 Tax=Streptococcus sp. DD13 TaxID=1777881 RepID=UPI00079585C8|nr:GbpC/Spa domain-containing protein [Streptococcus sp. DD13]KXT77957.1 hypothetical protein STRDD13_01114 [Streptococcus sp. DD13]
MKVTKKNITLFSALVLGVFSISPQVLADETIDTVSEVSDADRTTQAIATPVSTETKGTHILTRSEVTSPALETAKKDALKEEAGSQANLAKAQEEGLKEANTAIQQNTTLTPAELETAQQEARKNLSLTEKEGYHLKESRARTVSSVAVAHQDNLSQASAIRQSLVDYQAALTQYQKDVTQYFKDYIAYKAWEKAYQTYTNGTGDRVLTKKMLESAQGLIYQNEPNARMTVTSSQGSVSYLSKTIREAHAGDEILQQFNTDAYTNDDFAAGNGAGYSQTGGTFTEDVWLKMQEGETLTVTYTNLQTSSYNRTPIKKIVASYTLVQAPTTNGTALVELFHDPTKTFFVGSQTQDASKTIHVKMKLDFYDAESATSPIDLSGNNSIMSISSLNHWTVEGLGNHIEKVALNGNEFIKIDGSSVDVQADGYVYSKNDNQYRSHGALFNGDATYDANGNLIDEGWDAINPDGTPRSAKAYYGAGAMIYKGYELDLVAQGNDIGLPTAFWFATNSTIATPEIPDGKDKPTAPQAPSVQVAWHKNYVETEEAIPQPTPEVPGKNGKRQPSPEQPNVPKESPAQLPETGQASETASLALGLSLAIASLSLLAGGKLTKKDDSL